MKFFLFNDTATTEIYTLSLHGALPISSKSMTTGSAARAGSARTVSTVASTKRNRGRRRMVKPPRDRKSTRLNSSHANISYAVFCLKKKKTTEIHTRRTDQSLPSLQSQI